MQKIDGMSDQDSSFLLTQAFYNFFINSFSNMGIQGRNGVVHQYNISVRVDSSSKANPGFLTTAQVDAFFTDFRHVSSLENFQVTCQLASFDYLHVPFLIKIFTKNNVIPDGLILNPSLLLNIRQTSTKLDRWFIQI